MERQQTLEKEVDLGFWASLAVGIVSGALSAWLTQLLLLCEFRLGWLRAPTYQWIYYGTSFYFIAIFATIGIVAFRQKLLRDSFAWLKACSVVVVMFLGIQLAQLPEYLQRGAPTTAYILSTSRSLAEILAGLLLSTYVTVLATRAFVERS